MYCGVNSLISMWHALHDIYHACALCACGFTIVQVYIKYYVSNSNIFFSVGSEEQ